MNLNTKKNKKNKDVRKMSRLEKKEYNSLQKAKKESLKIEKKIATGLRWMDIEDVTEDYIILQRNKKTLYVTGIKLEPHNILLDREDIQLRRIADYEYALNQIGFDFWIESIQAPVNCDNWLNDLRDSLEIETDPVIRSMIQSDMNKIYEFQRTRKSKEFFVLIRGNDTKELEKNLIDLQYYFGVAGFNPKRLSEIDYYSFISFTFDNSLINDYVFSRGILSYLKMETEYDPELDEYKTVNRVSDFSALGEIGVNAIPSRHMIKKSKLAPTAYGVHERYVTIGDKFASFLIVTNMPPVFDLAILSNFVNNPNIKMFSKFSTSRESITKMLNNQLNTEKDRYRTSKDETEKKKIEQNVESLMKFINDAVRSKDKTYKTTLIFEITGYSLKEMNEEKNEFRTLLNSSGFNTFDAAFLQDQCFRMAVPLFIEDRLPSVIAKNYSFPLLSDSVAGLYPFIYDELNDKKGYLIGEELTNKGKIFFDPFYYINEHQKAGMNARVNGNTIVIGRSGSGKSTTMNVIIRNFIRNKTSVVWVDPENKNAQLTKHYRGTYIEWGREGYMINIFDLKPNSSEEDEDDSYKYDTRAAINTVIEDVCQFFRLLYPKISDDAIALIGPIVNLTYHNAGISPDTNKSFKNLTREDMPTFIEFNEALKEAIKEFRNDDTHPKEVAALNELSIKMKRILNEWSVYFVGKTNINLARGGRNIVSFGTKRLLYAEEELQNVLYYIMFKYSWSLCLDETVNSAFIIDEAHTLILKGSTAKLVEQFIRRSRKYKNVMLIGTQEARDFADPSVLTQGKAIFNNSIYKIAMSMTPDSVQELSKLETVNENEQLYLTRFAQAQALFMIGSDVRIPIRVYATNNELSEMGSMFTDGIGQ